MVLAGLLSPIAKKSTQDFASSNRFCCIGHAAYDHRAEVTLQFGGRELAHHAAILGGIANTNDSFNQQTSAYSVSKIDEVSGSRARVGQFTQMSPVVVETHCAKGRRVRSYFIEASLNLLILLPCFKPAFLLKPDGQGSRGRLSFAGLARSLWFCSPDCTHPAYVQRGINLNDKGGHYLHF